MDFDGADQSFSNLRDVASDPSHDLAWPAFTPDGKWVVYHAGSSPQFETDSGANGDLYFTSSTSSTQARLDALDGYHGGQAYLPANDPELSFAPTVLPEAVGGYFWVVFTSHRSYGNTLASMATGPSGPDDARQALGRGLRHQRRRGHGPEPPRLLPRRAGAPGRQPARLLGARPVQAGRRLAAPPATSAAAASAAPGDGGAHRVRPAPPAAARTSTRSAPRPPTAA